MILLQNLHKILPVSFSLVFDYQGRWIFVFLKVALSPKDHLIHNALALEQFSHLVEVESRV